MNVELDSDFIRYRPPRHAGKINTLLDDDFIAFTPPRHATGGSNNLLLEEDFIGGDHVFGGNGYFAGQGQGIVTVTGQPAQREIWLISLSSQYQLIRRLWSDEKGGYCFDSLDPEQEYLLLARDYQRELAPFGWDFQRPATDKTRRELLDLLISRGFVIYDHDKEGL